MHVSRDVDVRVSGVTESEPDGRTGVIFTGCRVRAHPVVHNSYILDSMYKCRPYIRLYQEYEVD